MALVWLRIAVASIEGLLHPGGSAPASASSAKVTLLALAEDLYLLLACLAALGLAAAGPSCLLTTPKLWVDPSCLSSERFVSDCTPSDDDNRTASGVQHQQISGVGVLDMMLPRTMHRSAWQHAGR